MKFVLPILAFLIFTTNALAVNRCLVDGKTVFQDSACPGSLGTVGEETQRRAKRNEEEKDSFLKHSLAGNCTAQDCRTEKLRVLEAEAKAAVVERMIDPKSTEFRNVKAYAGVSARKFYAAENISGPLVIDVVCGEVNSKNKLGGYVGFKPFRWASDGKLGLPDPDKFQAVLSRLIVQSCVGLEK